MLGRRELFPGQIERGSAQSISNASMGSKPKVLGKRKLADLEDFGEGSSHDHES